VARAGPKKVHRYSLEFKRTAVQLSRRPGIQVQAVLIFAVTHDGTAPADDVDITLHFPDGLDVVASDDTPRKPRKPQPPVQPRSPMEMMQAGFSRLTCRSSCERPGSIFPRMFLIRGSGVHRAITSITTWSESSMAISRNSAS